MIDDRKPRNYVHELLTTVDVIKHLQLAINDHIKKISIIDIILNVGNLNKQKIILDSIEDESIKEIISFCSDLSGCQFFSYNANQSILSNMITGKLLKGSKISEDLNWHVLEYIERGSYYKYPIQKHPEYDNVFIIEWEKFVEWINFRCGYNKGV